MRTLSIAVLALLGKVSAEQLAHKHKVVVDEGDPQFY